LSLATGPDSCCRVVVCNRPTGWARPGVVEKRPFHLDQMLELTPIEEDTATVSATLDDHTAALEAAQRSIAFWAAQQGHDMADRARAGLVRTISSKEVARR